MADLIQNVQEVFKKWESRPVSNRGRSRGGAYRYKPQRPRYEERQSSFRSTNFRESRKPRFLEPKYEGLAEFKMVPTVAPLQNSRPYLGMPCAKCAPRSRASVDDATVYLLSVYNALHIPYNPIETLNICCILNLFKMNKPFTSPDFSYDLLKSKQVEEAMQIAIDSQEVEASNLKEAVYKRSKEILCGLKSSLSSVCVGATSFCLHFIFKKMFSGIFVHKGQVEVLKILKKEDIPFIYLPLNRTHFDYILPSYILHLNSLKTPFIIVPEKFNIPFLSSFLRMLGAVFVKDEFLSSNPTSDCLYNAIAKSYVLRCLGSHNDIMFFLENSCSITGKPKVPSMNLLSAIVNAVSEGLLEDVYIVPMSIMYELPYNHASQQLESDSNKSETSLISKLFQLWKFFHLKCGSVRVNFNQPFSLKEFLKEPRSCHSFNLDCRVLSESQIYVKDLANHIIYDAIQSSSLMCTHLLAFLFVTQYRKGGTQQQLESNMDWLREEINKKKWDLGFSGESLPAIKRAVEFLGKHLISTETIEMEWTSSDLENNNVRVKVFTPVLKLPHVLELQYYANAVVPVFVKESIVVSALYALVDVDICHFHHFDSRFFVFRDELLQKSIELCNFLKYEFFTIAPCQDAMSVFNDVIDQLIEKECLSSTGPDQRYLSSNKKSRALSFTVSSDEEESDSEVMQQLKVDLREESICHLEFLRNVLSPYVECYWLAACSLLKLIDEVKEESVFIREMQLTAEEKLYKGLLAYEESFSASTLQNSLKMFNDLNIIEYYVIDNFKTLCLSEPFNNFEAVNKVIEDIEDFRK